MAACQRAISSREFAEWIAYDRLSPIGPERIDIMLASFMALFANANKAKKHVRFKINQFLPPWWKRHDDSEPLDWRDLKDKVMAMHKAFGGKQAEPAPGDSRWRQ